jgi:hypothetical protein
MSEDGGYPRKIHKFGVEDVLALDQHEKLYFDEESETWNKPDDERVLRLEWEKPAALWVRLAAGGGFEIEFWRRQFILDFLFYRESEPAHWTRNENGKVYIIYSITIQRGLLGFYRRNYSSDRSYHTYFIDVIETVKIVEKNLPGKAFPWWGPLFRRWNVVIQVGGREHVVADGLPPNTAYAVRDLIAGERWRLMQ